MIHQMTLLQLKNSVIDLGGHAELFGARALLHKKLKEQNVPLKPAQIQNLEDTFLLGYCVGWLQGLKATAPKSRPSS